MMLLQIILAATTGLVGAVEAPQPIFSIFGISTEDVDHYPQGKSQCLKWNEDQIFCPTGWQLGSVRMQSLTFLYTLGRLSEVRGVAKRGEFDLLVKSLELKYGTARLVNGEKTWQFHGGRLVARKIAPQISQNLADSEFCFTSEENAKIPSREPLVNF